MVAKSSSTPRRRSRSGVTGRKQRTPTASRAMNFRVPMVVADAIDQLVDELDASKTNVIIALLNAGLDITAKRVPSLRRLR